VGGGRPAADLRTSRPPVRALRHADVGAEAGTSTTYPLAPASSPGPNPVNSSTTLVTVADSRPPARPESAFRRFSAPTLGRRPRPAPVRTGFRAGGPRAQPSAASGPARLSATPAVRLRHVV